jgi:hypothetical protein
MANPPQLLVIRKRTPIQVHIQSNILTLVQDGSDLAGVTANDLPNNATAYVSSPPANRVIEAFGKRFVVNQQDLASDVGTIRERDQGGAGNYGIVYSWGLAANINGGHSGIHIVHINGKEAVALLYYSSAGTDFIQAVWSHDGLNWNETTVANPQTIGTTSTAGIGRPYGSAILWVIDGSGPTTIIMMYDFETAIATQISSSGAARFDGTQGLWALAIHDNKVFLALSTSSTSNEDTGVRRLDGISWVNVYQNTSDIFSVGGLRHLRAMFTDPATGDLIVMFMESAPNVGMKVIQIKGAATKSGLTDASPSTDIVNLTLTVLPPALLSSSRTGAGGLGTHSTSMYDVNRVFVDNVTTPGSPVVFLVQAQSPNGIPTTATGTTHNWYQWNGVSSLITTVGAAATNEADWVICDVVRGGGERIPTIGAARPVWDGGTLLNHGTVTSGPFVAGTSITSSGTGVGRIQTVYSDSIDIDVTSGLFLDTEVITAGAASATLSADSIDLSTPVEEAGGQTKVYFRVRGTGSAINLQVYFNNGSEAPDALMNLVATTVTVEAGTPATTPTNSSTQISNVTPDGGSAIYSVNLQATAAGILSGQGYSLLIVPV